MAEDNASTSSGARGRRMMSDEIARRIAVIARAMAACVVAIGLIVLFGWARNIVWLTQVTPTWPRIAPLTAVCFVISGLSLWLIKTSGDSATKRIAQFLALIITVVAVLRLGNHAFHWLLSIDRLGFSDTAQANPPARMLLFTTLNFLLLGIALLLATSKRFIALFQVLIVLSASVAWLELAHYLYGGAPLFHEVQMSFVAAVTFLILASGVYCARTDAGLMALMIADTTGGYMLRRLFLPAMAIPFFVGWWRLKAQRAGWFGTEGGLAVFALSNAVLFSALIWSTAILLHHASLKRRQARGDQLRLAAIVNSSNDAIVGKTLEGIVTSWNPGAEQLFGYTAQEMIGQPMLKLLPPDLRGEDQEALTRIADGETVARFESIRVRKDGKRINVSVTLSPITLADGRIIGAANISRDISERTQHRLELERLTRLYAALSQINQAIVWTQSKDELLRKICQVLVEHGGFRMAWIGWHDEQIHRLMPVAQWGDDTNYLQDITVYTDDRAAGPSSTAFREGRAYICNNTANDPITLPWRAHYIPRKFLASAALPIRMKDRVCALLNVYAQEVDFFQEQEVALLTEAATDISFALDNLLRADEHREAERIALNEKAFSEMMIESMPGIVYFYDLRGRFLRWNRNFEVISGYAGDEIAGMHPLDFFVDDDKRLVEERIAEVFTKGESSVEAPFATKAGATIPYFFTGRRVHFNDIDCLVGVGIDISEQKRAEHALKTSEYRYRTTLDNMLEGCQLLGFDWRYLYLNHAASVQNRRPNEELLGKTMPEMWPGIEGSEVFAMLKRCMDERIALHHEIEFTYLEGMQAWFDVRTQPVPDGIFVLSVEITERKHAERQLRDLNESLEIKVSERTQELEAAMVQAEAADRTKSAFLATMSHELRTPLNSIIGFTGIILQGLAGPLASEQKKQLGMVKDSARHLLDLINDVLDISKIEAGQLEVRAEEFDLRASIERVVELVRPLADKKQLALTAIIAPELAAMTSDRRRSEQILLNLLNNAIKFSDHGSITLIAEAVSNYSSCQQTALCTAMRVRVRDTGIGIKQQDLEILFKPFRQIDTGLQRQHDGTGLGLAICRRLAVLLGGDITVASEWGRGSEFVVTLPLQLPPMHDSVALRTL